MMNMKTIYKLLMFLVYILSIVLISRCGTESSDPFDQTGFNPWDNNLNNRVETYFDASQPQSATQSGGSRVYIDFSNGLVQAYKGNVDNASMLEKMVWIR
jgi:hypothetical protein